MNSMSDMVVISREDYDRAIASKLNISPLPHCYVMAPYRDPAAFVAMGVYAAAAEPSRCKEVLSELKDIDKNGFDELSHDGTQNIMHSMAFTKNFGPEHVEMIGYALDKQTKGLGFNITAKQEGPYIVKLVNKEVNGVPTECYAVQTSEASQEDNEDDDSE